LPSFLPNLLKFISTFIGELVLINTCHTWLHPSFTPISREQGSRSPFSSNRSF
jgi:hypothetical protein